MSILRALRTAAVVTVGLAVASCSAVSTGEAPTPEQTEATSITVQTNTGEVAVPADPQRVAALDNTSFETLLAMGITPVAVPKQLLPDAAQAWADDAGIADVGTHREPQFEVLNEADPDLIIGGKRFVEHTKTLEALAPVVDLAPNVESDGYVEALKQQTTTLGEIFGKQDVAAELNAALDDAVAEAAALTDGQTVFLANHNGGKIDNGAGRLAPLLEPLDMVDVFAGQAGGSDSVHNDSGMAPETVAQANPDWVIVMDRDAATGAAATGAAQATIEAQEAWRDTTFVSKDQIVYLEPTFYYTEGIEAYTTFYEQLATALKDAA